VPTQTSIIPRSARSALHLVILPVLLSCATLTQAQPDLRVVQLLFEPRPIPQDASTGEDDFASIDTLPQLGTGESVRTTGLATGRRNEISDSIASYIARIGDLEGTDGPYTNQLTEDLLATGKLYQELGEHAEAIDFLTRARNISRINRGIDTLEQVPILQALVDSHMAQGRLQEADAVQESLLNLQISAHGDSSAQTASALNAMGEWNLRAFLERSNIALNIQRMNVTDFMYGGNFTTGDRGANLGYVQENNPTATPLYKLYLAQGNFLQAINVLVQNQDFANPELLELERKLLTTMFLRTHQENIVYAPDFYLNRKTQATGTRLDTSGINLRNSEDYAVGKTSLERRMAYLASNEQRTPAQVASTMLEQADWELLFERTRNAEQQYAAAYQFFEANPQMLDSIRELVYPAVPVVLPTFLPAANSREKLGIDANEEVEYFGYFDVAFSLTKNGKARSVKILDHGGQVSKNMEIRLNDYLKNLVFRPRFRDGKLDTGTLRLRYYVGY